MNYALVDHMSHMDSPQKQKPRILKVDIHVLAYLGDYVTAFKAAIKKKAQDVLVSSSLSPQARSPAGRS